MSQSLLEPVGKGDAIGFGLVPLSAEYSCYLPIKDNKTCNRELDHQLIHRSNFKNKFLASSEKSPE